MAEATNTESTKYERHIAEEFEKAVRKVEDARHELNVSSSGYSGNLMWDTDPSEYIGRLNELAKWKRQAIIALDIALVEVQRLLDCGAAEAYRKVEIEKSNARDEAMRMAYSAKQAIANVIDGNK